MFSEMKAHSMFQNSQLKQEQVLVNADTIPTMCSVPNPLSEFLEFQIQHEQIHSSRETVSASHLTRVKYDTSSRSTPMYPNVLMVQENTETDEVLIITSISDNISTPVYCMDKEVLGDVKLMLKPIVSLEKLDFARQSKQFGNKLQSKEGRVKLLKNELQQLRNELDMERTWSKNLQSYIQAVEMKEQKQTTVTSNEQISQTNGHESPIWIRVEENSDEPGKKVFYVFNGHNADSDNNFDVRNINNEMSSDVRNSPRFPAVAQRISGSPCSVLKQGFTGIEDAAKQEKLKQHEMVIHKEQILTNSYKAKNLNSREAKLNKCSYCNKCFAVEKKLMKHIVLMHLERPFECQACDLPFGTEKDLKSHMKSHSISKYQCKICGEKYFTLLRLKTHLTFHMSNFFGCNACKMQFVELKELKKHLPCVRAMDGIPQFLCLQCKRPFTKGLHLQRHVSVYHSEKPEVSNNYTKHYLFKQTFNTEGKNSNEKKRYTCEKCGKKFRFASSVKAHLPCYMKKCQLCESVFESNQKLNIHKKRFHSEKGIQCPCCKMTFNNQYQLTQHEIKYQGQCQDSVRMCDLCGKFWNKRGWTRHMRIHGVTFSNKFKSQSAMQDRKTVTRNNVKDKLSIANQGALGREEDDKFSQRESFHSKTEVLFNETIVIDIDSDDSVEIIDKVNVKN